ncbi:MAG TPA: hypothetical protein PKY30_04105 [Myxococcota bacterium]|nr:hypothetical protein [Myxococcota bacterium]
MICRSLRNKALYATRGLPLAQREALLALHECPSSCLQTGQPWGLDGQPVHSEDCTPARACFRPEDPIA